MQVKHTVVNEPRLHVELSLDSAEADALAQAIDAINWSDWPKASATLSGLYAALCAV